MRLRRLSPGAAAGGALAFLLSFGTACNEPEPAATTTDEPPETSRCGPVSAEVAEVIDGDTIVLGGGEKVRYLLVDTPEITNGKNECFGAEARNFNAEYVLGRTVELTLLIDGSAFVAYLDGEVALTCRGSDHVRGALGAFVSGGDLTVSGLEVRPFRP